MLEFNLFLCRRKFQLRSFRLDEIIYDCFSSSVSSALYINNVTLDNGKYREIQETKDVSIREIHLTNKIFAIYLQQNNNPKYTAGKTKASF